MLPELLQTVIMSAVTRVMASMGTLYFAIAATLIVVVCGYLLYKHFFTKSASAPIEEPKHVPQMMEAPSPQKETPQDREEAFAAAMQAEQEAAEQELQKRIAQQQDAHTSSNEEHSIEHVQ